MTAGTKTGADYRATRAPRITTAEDGEGEENEMTTTATTTPLLTAAAAVSNCLWGGSGYRDDGDGQGCRGQG